MIIVVIGLEIGAIISNISNGESFFYLFDLSYKFSVKNSYYLAYWWSLIGIIFLIRDFIISDEFIIYKLKDINLESEKAENYTYGIWLITSMAFVVYVGWRLDWHFLPLIVLVIALVYLWAIIIFGTHEYLINLQQQLIKKNHNKKISKTPNSIFKNITKSTEDELHELKSLYEKGLISKDVYEQKQKKLIGL